MEQGGNKSGGILHLSLMWKGLSMKKSGHKGAKKENWYRCKFCIKALWASKRQHQMWQDTNKLLCIFSATVFISCAVEVVGSKIGFLTTDLMRFENDTLFWNDCLQKQQIWKRYKIRNDASFYEGSNVKTTPCVSPNLARVKNLYYKTMLFTELSIWYIVVDHIFKNDMSFSKSTIFFKYHTAVL